MVIAVGSSAMAGQPRQAAAPAQAPAAAGQGNVNLNVSQIPIPVSGAPYRFSLCLGRLLNPGEVSAPCRPAQSTAAKTVSGTAGNSVVTFRLQNGSFLPPGLHLDGFGVISGTTDVDLSKLNVKICAIQLGGYGSNFNCQGQPVGFGKEVVLGNTPAPPPAAAPAQAAAATGGGAGTTAMVTALGLAGAGALGYAAYKASETCTEPSPASLTGCTQGSCSACATMLEEWEPYCDCVEQKHPDQAAGIGDLCRQATAAARQAAQYCLVPASSTPAPQPAIRK